MAWMNSVTNGFPRNYAAIYVVQLGSDVYLCTLNGDGCLVGCDADGISVSLSDGWDFDYFIVPDHDTAN